jgi:hypothetical protein
MLTEDEIANARRFLFAYVTIRYPDGVTVDAPIGTATGGGVNQQLELNGVRVHLFFGSSLIGITIDKELLEEAKGACLQLSDRRWWFCGKDFVGRRVPPFWVRVGRHGNAHVIARHPHELGRVEALLRMSLVLAMGW